MCRAGGPRRVRRREAPAVKADPSGGEVGHGLVADATKNPMRLRSGAVVWRKESGSSLTLRARRGCHGKVQGTRMDAAVLEYEGVAERPGERRLLWVVLALALPSLFEQIFN